MPLPLGHAAIGWAAHETITPAPQHPGRDHSKFHWSRYAFAVALANLPDLDVLYGLVVYGNGGALHRGPTHSLLFAVLAGLVISQLWRWWPRIPRYGFGLCFALIFSHVAADMLLTASPVSLMWPFELYLTPDHNGWGDVVQMVLFQSIQDIGIVAACLSYVFILRQLRGLGWVFSRFAFARRRTRR